MEINILKRSFLYKDLNLTDPNSQMSSEEVLEHYSAIYPEMATAVIIEKEITETEIIYEINLVIGEKG